MSAPVTSLLRDWCRFPRRRPLRGRRFTGTGPSTVETVPVPKSEPCVHGPFVFPFPPPPWGRRPAEPLTCGVPPSPNVPGCRVLPEWKPGRVVIVVDGTGGCDGSRAAGGCGPGGTGREDSRCRGRTTIRPPLLCPLGPTVGGFRPRSYPGGPPSSDQSGGLTGSDRVSVLDYGQRVPHPCPPTDRGGIPLP